MNLRLSVVESFSIYELASAFVPIAIGSSR